MKNFYLSLFLFLGSFLQALTTSVIIPCNPNNLENVPEILNAYNMQSELPDEIIISISNASKIKSEKIKLIKLIKTNFIVDLRLCSYSLYSGENKNLGFSFAKSDILICNDPNYYPDPKRIEVIKKKFSSNQVDVLFHDVDQNDLKFSLIEYPSQIDDNYQNLSIKKEVFQKIKWQPLPYSEDFHYIIDCLMEGFKVGFIDAQLINNFDNFK